MKRVLLAVMIVILAMPVAINAQKAGTFVGSLGAGLTSAQGNFADGAGLSAGSGSALEAELRLYIIRGFAIGGFANYTRFGSGYGTTAGRVSYNFSQLGGLAKMNFLSFSDGRLYLTGGAGIFTPNTHFYIPDNSFDRTGNESGTFFFGGVGLISRTDRNVLYELEVRYNIASADYYTNELDNVLYKDWNFIYFGMKLSFASKGKPAPPKY